MEIRNLLDENHTTSAALRMRSDRFDVSLEQAGSAARALLERQVAAKFAAQYDAQLNQFHPFLIALQNAGRPLAIAGLRPARDAALFLEKYLDSPAEQAVSSVFRMPVDRAQIIEIGNLVSTERGSSYFLFFVLAPLLRCAGFRWVICTATPQVERTLKKMHLAPQRICTASRERLGKEALCWGSYYDSEPHVIAGDLEHAASQITRVTNLSSITNQLGGWSEAVGKICQRVTR